MSEHKEGAPDPAAKARADYIVGLRRLADLLVLQPDVPVPGITIFPKSVGKYGSLTEEETKDKVKKIAKGFAAAGYRAEKRYDSADFELEVQLSPEVYYLVSAHREAVCKKHVISTEKVTKQVPDYSAIPTKEEEVEVESIEWECEPLLGP